MLVSQKRNNTRVIQTPLTITNGQFLLKFLDYLVPHRTHFIFTSINSYQIHVKKPKSATIMPLEIFLRSLIILPNASPLSNVVTVLKLWVPIYIK